MRCSLSPLMLTPHPALRATPGFPENAAFWGGLSPQEKAYRAKMVARDV